MADIEFIDTTLRDGHQSLWGLRLQTGMALPVAPLFDAVGYEVIDLTGSSMMEVLVRYCHEDPWEGLDLLIGQMPKSRFRAGMRSNGIVTFSVTPDALMDLWIRTLCRHGIDTFWIYDVLHYNIDKTHRLARIAKEHDAMVVAALMFTSSPVHTDAFYAERAARYCASEDVDRIVIYDTGGVLTPERVRTLVPAITARVPGTTLEIHSHNVVGMSPSSYLEAIEQGVHVVHTCNPPLANGPSLPSVVTMARNVVHAGHRHRLDVSLFAPIRDHLEAVAKRAGFPLGVPSEYDLRCYEHQVPGGMTGTFRNQLAQHGMSERLDEVLREIAVVRRELGYPGMATPFSQLVGTLAVLNIVTGERYSVIPDEVIQYAAGHYGEPVAPIEPDILDRIMQAPKAAAIAGAQAPQPSLDELRAKLGRHLSDEELILHALVPRSDIEKMHRAGPVARHYETLASSEVDQVKALMRTTGVDHLELATAEFSLTLKRHREENA